MITPVVPGDVGEGRAELAGLLRRRQPPAVLFGAGVSARPPSSLPTASALLEQYRGRVQDALCDEPQLAAGIPPLAAWTALRFEQVVSILHRTGVGREAISPLDAAREPNENHELLASAYLAGWPLLTTNFDVLAEIAILRAGGHLRQVVDRESHRAEGQLGSALYKLHGSCWTWSDGRWRDSRDALANTFESIGQQYARYLRNDAQKLLLARVVRERPLIVVGYSGTDDFDIAPIVLHSTRKQPLLWLQHDADGGPPTVAMSATEVPKRWRPLVPPELFAASHRHDVCWIVADTTAMLRELVGHRGPRSARHASVPLPASSSDRALPAGMLASVRHACLLVGMLLAELDRARDAIPYIERARGAHDVRLACMAEYELARAHTATGDTDRARDQLERCVSLARRHAQPWMEGASLDLLGRLTADRSLVAAEERFWAALAVIDRHRDPSLYGWVLTNLGEVLWKRGDQGQAYETLVHAAELLEASGELEGLVRVQYQLAIWCSEAGRLDEARVFARSALELSDQLGYVASRVKFLHELGIIEQNAGRATEAERCFREVVQRTEGSATLDTALALYHLGWLAYQNGEVDRADALERQSSQILQRLDQPYFLAHNLGLRAVVHLHRGQIRAGSGVLDDAISLSRQVGDQVHIDNLTPLARELEHARPPEGRPYEVAAFANAAQDASGEQTSRGERPTPRERATPLWTEANGHWQRGDLLRAAVALEQAVHEDPSFGDAHYNLSEIYIQTGRLEDGLRHATEAIRCNPTDADAHNNRGSALAQLERFDEAVPNLKRAIELRPDFAMAHYNLALAHYKRARPREAAEHWRTFLSLDPDDERAAGVRAILSELSINERSSRRRGRPV